MAAEGKLSAGFSYSDRVAPIFDGSAACDGVDIDFSFDSATRIFSRALEGSEFELAEMSLAKHCIARASGDRRFIGLPIFTSRMFRHHSIYVWGDRIRLPRQLVGGRIGVSDYCSTTAVWLRGVLAEYHGLDARDVSWCIGSIDGAAPHPCGPPNVLTDAPWSARQMTPSTGASLLDMLENGELDAIISPGLPPSLPARASGLRPLFDDPQAQERAYFKGTGIFPIMHLCVLDAQRHEDTPALAMRIYRLFERARQLAQERLDQTDALVAMAPWLGYAFDPMFDAAPGRGWAYGIQENRHCLQTFFRYLKEQELLAAPIGFKEIFAADFLGGQQP